MKKNIIITFLAFLIVSGSASAQFAAGYTQAGNILTFKLKPSVTTTTGFTVIEFFVRYPTGSPAFTYGPVSLNTTNFPGILATGIAGSGSWEIERNNPAYVIAGYNVDHIFYTGTASTTRMYTAGTEYDVVSIPLLSATQNTVNMEFVHQDSEASFYLALTSETGGDLRESSQSAYFFPNTTTLSGPGGSTIYLSALTAVVPVKFLGFTATKNNNNALLNWSVENENSNTASYEVELSATGVNFDKIATIAPLNNGRTANTYNFTQQNLSSVRNNGVIYFRIKQIDTDGKFVYTAIRSVRLDGKTFAVNAFPNPVKDFTKVTIDLVENTPINIVIVDAAGKQVDAVQMQGIKGLNVKNINLSAFASGSYLIKVQAGAELKTIAVVKTN